MHTQAEIGGLQQEFETRLMARRAVLQEEIGEALRDVDQTTGGNYAEQLHNLNDKSLSDMLLDLRLADMHRDLEELHDLDGALSRLRDGKFGICTECGEPVPLERLQAYPTAKRCRPCQELHERERDIRRKQGA